MLETNIAAPAAEAHGYRGPVLRASYVLPLRMEAVDDARTAELTDYLHGIAARCEDVVVVDGSLTSVFATNERRWRGLVRHVAPDPAHASLNGKVAGVLTGLALARHDRVVIADDDVRYDQAGLARAVAWLDGHDLVVPQNFFSPLPWHAVWDTARTLLNRATLGGDFPGTFAIRRSTLLATGGYDGDVLFENLELIRTVRAAGGAVAWPLDLFVRRLPPTTGHFLGQRTRQAYDEFALPHRMTIWLATLPVLAVAVARRGPKAGLAAASVTIALAERGRRRAGGTAVFPVAAVLLAPLWVLERACCAWLAALQRVGFGGVRYGDAVIRVAAHSERTLRSRITRGHRMLLGGSAGKLSLTESAPRRPARGPWSRAPEPGRTPARRRP